MERTLKSAFDRIYPHPRKVLLIPLLIFSLAALILGYSAATSGAALEKGIDFTGGTSIQVQVPPGTDSGSLSDAFPEATVRTMSSGGQRWLILETKTTYSDDAIQRKINQSGVDYVGGYSDAVSVQTLGSSVGGAFFREAQIWAGIALLIMAAVIFVAFRSLIPSLAVIFAAVTDILVAMAGMALLGIDLTLGSLAALLMLLGYSVDTDILLSTRVLKQRKDDLKERMWSSIVTGTTMSVAAIAAFTVLYLVSTAATLDQIAAVIVIGLIADLPITWLGNAFILKWYVERE